MIVTFYSYKGGVGRTQLCANIAAYLCYYKSKKVLLWDWDFEAPGLHYYFGKQNDDVVTPGTLELLEQYTRHMRSVRDPLSSGLPMLKKEEHIIPLVTAPAGNETAGCIDLLPAGCYTNDFSSRANEFSWFEFYDLLDGPGYLETLKKQLSNLGYDYIFVDSRTGISDYSGICNIQLPDINLMVIAPTMQNFRGSVKTANAILESPYIVNGFRKPHILPILSRLDRSHPKFNDWIQNFITDFSFLLTKFDSDVSPDFQTEIFADTYLQETFLQYIESISAGENIFFDNHARHLPRLSFARTFINIAEYIEKINNDGALNLYSKVDMDTWLGYAEKAMEVDMPVKAAYAYTRAGLIQIQSEPKQAIHYFEQALKCDDKNEDALLYIGITFSNLNQKSKAIEYFQKCIELNSKAVDAIYYLGCVYVDLPKKDKALQYFNMVLSIIPEHVWALFQCGKIYKEMGKSQLALDYFQRVLNLQPDYSPAWHYSGTIFAETGKMPEAIDAFEKAISLDPNNSYYYWTLGELLSDNDRDDEAAAAMEIALELDPENASLYGWKGYLLRKKKKIEHAIPMFEKSIEFDSTYRWAYASLALCHQMLGHERQFREFRDFALDLDPRSLENEYQRACFEALLGHVDRTLQLLTQAFLKNQKRPEFIARDIDFDPVRNDPKFIAFMERALSKQLQVETL